MILGSLEILDPVRTPPAYEIKAKVTSAGLEEEEEESGPLEDGEVQIFSDGLGLDGRVGATAVMYRRGREPKVLYYNMGLLTKHTVFKAEAVGVILALHMLKDRAACQEGEHTTGQPGSAGSAGRALPQTGSEHY